MTVRAKEIGDISGSKPRGMHGGHASGSRVTGKGGRRAAAGSSNFMLKQLTGDRPEERSEASRNNKALPEAFSFNIGDPIGLGCSWRLTV